MLQVISLRDTKAFIAVKNVLQRGRGLARFVSANAAVRNFMYHSALSIEELQCIVLRNA